MNQRSDKPGAGGVKRSAQRQAETQTIQRPYYKVVGV